MTPLSEWQNFYVIVGSAAGGLTGLQFVTMALLADMPLAREEMQASTAFSTPSVVHFATVLLLAALLVMPWGGVGPPAVIWGLAGLTGVAYTSLVAWRMQHQKAYTPVLEDWLFRIILPLIGYLALAGSAWVSRSAMRAGMFGVASAALLLLVLGIHNAWDNVTYLVFVRRRDLNDRTAK